jgi:LysR family transcriptional regulator, hca operon transcriptional activator
MDEMLNIEVRVFSGFSTTLADDLQRGKLDIAFLRPEPKPDLEYKLVTKEPLVAIMPNDHSLAAREAVEPSDFVAEKFVGISNVAPILRSVVNDYLAKGIVPALEIDNYMMAISFVTSTRGVALLPVSVLGLLPSSVVSRPLMGEQPTVDLVLGYHKANGSQILRKFLSKIDDATVRVYGKQARRGAPGPNQV